MKKLLVSLLLTQLVIAPLFASFLVPSAHAASAGDSYIRCDRMKAATDPGDCLVVFTTSATTFTEAYLELTFDSEWESDTNFSSTATDFTVSTTGIPAGVTAMPSVATGDDVTGNTVRFPIGALSNSTTYGFFITGGLTVNPSASTTIIHTLATRDSGDSTTGDTIDVAVPVISDDQVVITAAVAPSFTFVFANNAQDLGTLSTSAVTSGSGTAITINTNAPNGWNAWVKSANEALSSTAASKDIDTAGSIDASPTTLSTGSEGYVLDVDATTDGSGGGTVSIAGEYDGGSTSAGGTLSTSFQTIATSDGTASNDVITLIPRATIAGSTPAANDYTDTLTVVGAGVF